MIVRGAPNKPGLDADALQAEQVRNAFTRHQQEIAAAEVRIRKRMTAADQAPPDRSTAKSLASPEPEQDYEP